MEQVTSVAEQIIRERVARGMAWIKANGARLDLDLDRVDLDTLRISEPEWCVIAQAGGDGQGWYRLFDADELPPEEGYEEGFLPDWRLDPNGDLLNTAWRDAILADRAATASP